MFSRDAPPGRVDRQGRLYANVIRTGLPLNATTGQVDELIAALDAGLAFAASRKN